MRYGKLFPLAFFSVSHRIISLLLHSGNPLGTRYRPCKTAASSIFSSRSRPSASMNPEGSQYWHAHSPPTHSRGASSPFFVYTFFSANVMSSPSFTFPPRPALTVQSLAPLQSQPQIQVLDMDSEPADEADMNTPTFNTFERMLTASPSPLSEAGEVDGESSPFQAMDGAPYFGRRVEDSFDPDGELIATEPNSPDKTGDVMLFPGR